MKIRRFFCAVLTTALILSMTPVAWADTGNAEADPYTVEEQATEATEDAVVEQLTEMEPDVAVSLSEDPATEESTESTEASPDAEAPPAVIAESTVCDLVQANGYGDLQIETVGGGDCIDVTAPALTVLLYDPGYYLSEYSGYNWDESIELVEGQDYTISCDSIEGETATVSITGIGRFTGTVSRQFSVSGISISDAEISAITSKTYKATAWKPEPAVVLNGETLVKDVDYTLSYSGNVSAGTATVTVTGIGDYAGTATQTFKILKKDLSKASVIVKTGSVYSGVAKKPTVTVRLMVNGTRRTLKKGTDYTVKYSNNIKAGRAKVTITGIGNYKGTAVKYFTIKKRSISAAKVTGVSNKFYTGKAVKPTPTVKLKIGSTTKTLKKGTDYTVSYKNNVKKGTATVIIKGKGNYTGTVKKTFKIMSRTAYYETKYAGTWHLVKAYHMGSMPMTADELKDMGYEYKYVFNRKNHRIHMYTNGKLVQGWSYTYRVSGKYVYIYYPEYSTESRYEIKDGILSIATGPRDAADLRK